MHITKSILFDLFGRLQSHAAYDLLTKHLFSSYMFSFVSSEGVSYMTVCHCSLPIAKAFCFLEDLRWEFTACSNSAAIALADRPYLFLEFGEQGGIYSSRFCAFTHCRPFHCLTLRWSDRRDHSEAEAAVQQKRRPCSGGDIDRSPE